MFDDTHNDYTTNMPLGALPTSPKREKETRKYTLAEYLRREESSI
jgi:hypothetical protein